MRLSLSTLVVLSKSDPSIKSKVTEWVNLSRGADQDISVMSWWNAQHGSITVAMTFNELVMQESN